ncbi:MAG: metallophosphoesterase [Clostridia bacterium]
MDWILKYEKIIFRVLVGGIIIVSAMFFSIWQNNIITTSTHTYENKKIPPEFDGFKIVHISDLHNKKFGRKEAVLLNKIDKCCPDIIVITGDIIDFHRYNEEVLKDFISGATSIAPTYYVPGNHESTLSNYNEFIKILKAANVNVLENEKTTTQKGNATLDIIGVLDPTFYRADDLYSLKDKTFEGEVQNLAFGNEESFKILLTHRPESLELYASNNYDLIFAGHAHGGQIRLPFTEGIIAPVQGYFPKLTSGKHTIENSTMYISRGLGNSLFPQRIFNQPEIVAVTLKADKS